MELEADVVVECHASTGSVVPDCARGTCTRRHGIWGERVQFGSSQKEHRQTLGFDDEDVKTIAVDVGIPLGKA